MVLLSFLLSNSTVTNSMGCFDVLSTMVPVTFVLPCWANKEFMMSKQKKIKKYFILPGHFYCTLNQ